MGRALIPGLAAAALVAGAVASGAIPGDGVVSGAASALQVDHLAFLLGAGLLSAMIGRPLFAPIALVAATVAGAAARVAGLQLVAVDPACAIMATLAGVLLLIRSPFPPGAALVLFGFAGLFHGWRLAPPLLDGFGAAFGAHALGMAAAQYGATFGIALLAGLAAPGAMSRSAARVIGGALAFFGLVRAALASGG